MKTTTGKILGLSLLTALIFGTNFNANAQPTRNSRPGTNAPSALLQNPALTNSPTAVAIIRQVLATTPAPLSVPVIATTNFSEPGTYWTLQSPVPLPGDFFPDLPVYLLDATNRTFLIDDRSVDYAALQAQWAAENATNGSGLIFQANGLIIDTNRLWLSVATNALPGSNQFNVVIHETVTGNYYDVLTKTDLLLPTWAVESTVIGAAGNETPVTLAQNDRTNLFVWARESIIPIYTQPLAQEVYSGDSVTFTVAAGGSGLFYQWTLNGTNIYGATGSSYTIQNVNASNAGDYACIVHNADGTVTTQAATLTVDQGSGWPYDMSTVSQRQDYTFRSGVTYNITSPVQLFGKTTIEGGAIIKFDYNYPYPCLLVMGTLDCQGGAYNPAILTSVDDDTFGLAEQDSTGAPQPVFTGVPFLDLTYAGNVSLANLRFRYADMAVGAPYHARLDLWNCQFVQSYAGVVNEFGGTDGFHNVLFAGCFDAVAGNTNSYAVEMEQVTADVSNLWDSAVSPSRLALTNSIIFGNIGSVSAYSAQSVTVAPDATNFQTNGTGKYYLAAASSLRQSGTTNISARLRTELQQKTTSPPLAFPQLMNLTGNLTLMPQAGRYTNGAPDRGYYYDALDYTVAWMTVFGSITVEPGTAIGVRNEPIAGASRYTWWGLDLRENSSVVSHGLPNRPNIFSDTQTVQEQDEYASSSLFVPDFQGSPSDAAPVMDFRFNKLYAPAGGFQVWGGDWEFVSYGDNLASYDSLVNWTMRDCELHGGRISLGLPDINMDLTLYYGSGAVDWENNLFESVNINLNPATWWWNGMVNFDESLTARNNLFKGANWMAIEPVPASAGNWTFTDNLFDGIDFQADSAAPMDFDFNGYRPLPASQTLSNTMSAVLSLTANDSTALASATNNLGALHEVYLDYALPYVSGSFGKYYLSTVTPLWQAGSRTAADAGLSQYTTFINQAKDSASQPVNIGLHYVAATNSLPLDSDGDGVPDYVEVEYGTNPTNAMTDGVTPDAYNTAYDDVDLDGDGLTGAAERMLNANPLVSDNPLNFANIDLPTSLSGIATIPLNINPSADTNASIVLTVNGNSADTVVFQTNGNWYARWDTTSTANGVYQLGFEISPSDNADNQVVGTGFAEVQNAVCFPDNLSLCGGSLYVHAQTVDTNGTWTMTVYDDQGNLFTNLSGTVDANGFCDYPDTTQEGAVISLLDENGNQLPSNYYDVTVTTSPAATASASRVHANAAGGGASSGFRRYYNEKLHGGERRNWVIAYMPIYDNVDSTDDPKGKLSEMMEGAAELIHESQYGINNDAVINQQNTTWGYPYTFTLNAHRDWSRLMNLLQFSEARNFVYFGHGWSDLIGVHGGEHLDKSELQFILKNIPNPLKDNATNPASLHPYRFVFLDGCNTAKGGLPEIFGIPSKQVSGNDWDNKYHLFQRAFLGWSGLDMAHINKTMSEDHKTFYEGFWRAWTGADRGNLQNAINDASPVWDYWLQQNVPGTLSRSITIYGCPTLPFYQ